MPFQGVKKNKVNNIGRCPMLLPEPFQGSTMPQKGMSNNIGQLSSI